MRHLGAVGWEPTAELGPGILGHELGQHEASWGCRLGTYSRVGANMRHLGAVGWEPTAELGPT